MPHDLEPLGGTYGGNPVACAAALATLRLMEELQLNARAEVIGQRVTAWLAKLQDRFPDQVGNIRGIGAMVGIEFVEQGDPRQPATRLASQIQHACLAAGLLILTAGIHGNVIRFLMPLVITDEQLHRGFEIFTAQAEIAMESRQGGSEVIESRT